MIHSTRSLISVPKELECFAKGFQQKLEEGVFLGNLSEQRESLARGELQRVRCSAKALYFSKESLEPTMEALDLAKRAMQDFFALAFNHLKQKGERYPLAGYNKCLGLAVVPRTRLVLIALSQDREPEKDRPLREKLCKLIFAVNQWSKWIFELVRVPTQSEYLLLRTISMRAPHHAPMEWVEPRTRCCEPALMAALCKVGRFKRFAAAEAGIITFGCTLWASPKGNEAVSGFEGIQRNFKHVTKKPIEVKLNAHEAGWVDEWDPCSEHCLIYRRAMLAIGAAGGPATSFTEPRGDFFM